MDGGPPLQQVCSLNTRARSLGMVRSMTRVEVETLPFITVIPRSHKEEAATERVLLECSRGFSPCVEDRSENDAFLCVIDVVGTEKLFGPPEALARDLLAHVRAVGVIAWLPSAGISMQHPLLLRDCLGEPL
jgi:protein ImuB